MKKLLLLLILSACFLWANAQKDTWLLDGNPGTGKSKFLGTTDCEPLIFKTNNEERVRVLRDRSFLGIGLSAPKASLHLHYQIDAQSCDILSSPSREKNLLQLTTSETGSNFTNGVAAFYQQNSTDFTLKQQEQANFFLEGPNGGITIAPNGNIGIGTQQPQANLDVEGTIRAQNANILGVLTTNIFNVSGKFGVGTNAPLQKLHIENGNLLFKRTVPKPSKDPYSSIIFDVGQIGGGFLTKWGIEYVNSENEGYGLNFWKSDTVWGPPQKAAMYYSALFLSNEGYVGVYKKNPTATLDVGGSFKAESAVISGNTTIVGNAEISGNTYLNGDVGIGTNKPKQMLHVVGGNILISKTSTKDTDAPQSPNGSILFGANIDNSSFMGKWGIEYLNGEDNAYGLNFWRPWNYSGGGFFNYGLFLADNGMVGIGKKDPQVRLDVNGAINAHNANIVGIVKTKEVQVTLSDWPDYVFNKDYNLPTLNEVEQFIAENNHLPNVPSAAEVEANGIQLGEMNAILIQKIEELTLYIIEQEKLMKELEKRLSELENKKGGE